MRLNGRFYVGDVVVDENGNRMTVEKVVSGEVWCVWFDTYGRLLRKPMLETDVMHEPENRDHV